MAATNSNQLVQKLLNYRNVLRDDGVSTIDYVEQLTYLLFLKMADERLKAGLGEVVPHGLDWQSLLDRDGDDLEVHYRHILESLGRHSGTLGTIQAAPLSAKDSAGTLRVITADGVQDFGVAPGGVRPHVALLTAFARTLAEQAPNPIPGEEGLAGLRVVEAAYQSAQTGTRIRVDAING